MWRKPATHQQPRYHEDRGTSQAVTNFFFLFADSGSVFQNTVSLSLSYFLLNFFFISHPVMDVVCASFWTLIMRK